MVLEETIDLLKDLHGKHLDDLRVNRIVVGVFFSGIKLSDGSAGVIYTPTSDLHSTDSTTPMAMDKPVPPRITGAPVASLLRTGGASALDRTVTLVAVNALSAPFLTPDRYPVRFDNDVLDLVDTGRGGRVGMVGAIRPFLKRLKKVPGMEISVVEQKKESLADDEKKYFVPADRAKDVLLICDTVIITGATISNGTIDGLLAMIRPGTRIIVTGPTASMLPDALFARGVSIVSGVTVTDADLALDMVAEGAIAYHLFKTCLRKINIVSDRRPA
jgi:uncharacterized protein